MTRLNVGNLDRALRILLGSTLIGLAGFGTIGAWGYVGIVAVVTGLWGWCPLYTALGLSTTSR